MPVAQIKVEAPRENLSSSTVAAMQHINQQQSKPGYRQQWSLRKAA
jgi:hypothetical protein